MSLKKFISVVLVLVAFIPFISKVNAKTLAEFKKELSAAEAKYSKNESDKKATEKEKAATKEKINSIKAEKIRLVGKLRI